MLVSVECEVLSDEFVDDEVFVGEVGPGGRGIVEGAEYFCPDFGPDLSKNSSFFKGFLEDVFELVDSCHYI